MKLAPPGAKILYFCETSNVWKHGDTHDINLAGLPKCCYIFLPKTSYEEGKAEIFRQFNAPALLASKMGIDINGFFGSRRSHDEKERLKSYSTWYRCLVKMIYPYKLPTGKDYKWYEMTFVSRWEAPGSEQILCIDTPEDFPSTLSVILGDTAVDFNDPFAMHVPLLQEVVRLNDKSVWAIRDPIRDVEKRRPTAGPDFEAMHEISRHSIHVSEVLAVSIQTFGKILEQQRKIHEKLPVSLSVDAREQAHEDVDFQIQMMKSLKERSVSNYSRLTSEITVAYNRIAQQDNRVMKSIGLLTMTFLPATFISAIFSTTFFEYGEEKLQASKQLWIYWVVTIPSTLLIVIIWRSLLNKNPPVTWRTLWSHLRLFEWEQVKKLVATERQDTEKSTV
ncbi:uncharacterized protein TRUGW13939_06264 [Talaromyces rugulosus]|uniref:Uncharacterized protein n=1 Tax=Talaromyces rugulosus TaxID=121627 RepID=A0A7H8R2S3_TALRU|nr:uncharacterized protein TRUGW13939_06264 [Talaromyces rugulosus]QKX59133.1 hypothetical protein TRUGW13939_06264 [Talaromyces rugulosus]